MEEGLHVFWEMSKVLLLWKVIEIAELKM